MVAKDPEQGAVTSTTLIQYPGQQCLPVNLDLAFESVYFLFAESITHYQFSVTAVTTRCPNQSHPTILLQGYEELAFLRVLFLLGCDDIKALCAFAIRPKRQIRWIPSAFLHLHLLLKTGHSLKGTGAQPKVSHKGLERPGNDKPSIRIARRGLNGLFWGHAAGTELEAVSEIGCGPIPEY